MPVLRWALLKQSRRGLRATRQPLVMSRRDDVRIRVRFRSLTFLLDQRGIFIRERLNARLQRRLLGRQRRVLLLNRSFGFFQSQIHRLVRGVLLGQRRVLLLERIGHLFQAATSASG